MRLQNCEKSLSDVVGVYTEMRANPAPLGWQSNTTTCPVKMFATS